VTRGGVARGVALALLCAAVIGAVLFAYRRSGESGGEEAGRLSGDPMAEALLSQRPAVDPLEGFGETTVALGGRCLRVAVADEPAERTEGLREAHALGAYAGMLFVFPDDGRYTFTMADTLIDLDIGFYDAGGTEVDRQRMTPCAEGNDRSCPLYEASGPFRYAFETPAGALGSGALSVCG